MEPGNSPVTNLSFAEAHLPAGGCVALHYHVTSEEIYHVVSGYGTLTIGGDSCELRPGDTVRIGPGEQHKFRNTGSLELIFFCICSPPFSEADTILVPDTGEEL